MTEKDKEEPTFDNFDDVDSTTVELPEDSYEEPPEGQREEEH
jgi:hypothetical protein